MLLTAGKLKNLNDLVIGASVLTAEGLVGFIEETDNPVTIHSTGDICQIKATIKYPKSGSSYHTYRHDGRSTYESLSDIVRVCRPEDSKVKSIKVWSNQALDPALLEAGNNIALICKLYIDTEKKGKNWTGNTKPIKQDGLSAICKLGKSGILSVKVWRD